MAAFSFHRKMMEDPTNATAAAQICAIECDPKTPVAGGCTPFCSFVCPSLCLVTGSSPPPSSPPPFILIPPPKHHHSPLSLPLKISVVVLVVTFSLFLLYTLYKFYTVWYRSRRRRSPPPSPPGNHDTHDEFLDHDALDHPIWYIRTVGLQPSVINAITVVKFVKNDALIDSTYCSVCLSEFQEHETLRLLPKCNHAFHISCIDPWLRSHTNCPLCRAGILNNTANSPSPGQNPDDSSPTEETHVAISIPEEVNGAESQIPEDYQSSELRIGVLEDEDSTNKSEMIGGSGTNEFLIMRRSVSLNDFAGYSIRSDVANNYYSDRHEIQNQSLRMDLGIQLIKVDQTTNN